MHRLRLRRALPTILVTLALIGSLFAGTAVAKPPQITDSHAVPSPSLVSFGGLVRYDVTFTNSTSGNFQTVNMAADTPSGADLQQLLGSPSQGTCEASGEDLSCSFGFLASGGVITLAVLYRVPSSGASSMTVPFIFTVQGSTGSDRPGQSRGDDIQIEGTVNLTNDANIGSSYVFGDDLTVQNNQTLNKQRNPQSARASFSNAGENGFPASVEEKAANAFSCPPDVAGTCFGNWNVISAAGGAVFEEGFTVVLGYAQIQGNAASKKFVHLLNPNAANPQLGTDYELITDACTFDGGVATNMPCIASVTSQQGNTFYTLLVDDNGPMRGY